MKTRRQARSVVWSCVVVLALILVGCGGSESNDPAAAPDSSESNEPIAEESLPPVEEPEAKAERYETFTFRPMIDVRIPADWITFIDEPNFLLIEPEIGPPEGELGLAVVRLTHVVDPATATSSKPKFVSAPDDIVSWLQNHPELETSDPKPMTVAGMKGVSVTTKFTGKKTDAPCMPMVHTDCIELFQVGSRPPVYQTRAPSRVAVMERGGKVLVISAFGPPSQQKEVEAQYERFIKTLKF
jgi:hypothetical protein